MTREQFVERCRAMHEARYTLINNTAPDEDVLIAWRYFHQLVLDTAKEMQKMGWQSIDYFTAYTILEETMPENRLSGAISGEDEVATGLRWCYFFLGYEFYSDDEKDID